jgi:hypothetical protein
VTDEPDSHQECLREQRAALVRALAGQAARLVRVLKAGSSRRRPLDRRQQLFQAVEADFVRKLAANRVRRAEQDEQQRKLAQMDEKEKQLRAELGLDESSSPVSERPPREPVAEQKPLPPKTPTPPSAGRFLVQLVLVVASVIAVIIVARGCE